MTSLFILPHIDRYPSPSLHLPLSQPLWEGSCLLVLAFMPELARRDRTLEAIQSLLLAG